MGFFQDLFGPTYSTTTNQNQQQQSGSTSGGTSSTSSSTPTLSPELQQIMQQLLAYGNQSMTDPTAGLAPIRNAGLQQINQAYSGVPGQVAQQMASRGYGSSGKVGDAMYKTNLARAGSVSNLEGQLASQGIQQQQYGASLSEQLLNAMKGTSNTTTGTTYGTSNQQGTSSGSQTQPGPSIFSSMLGLGSTLLGIPGLGNLFGGGGSAPSSGYAPGSIGMGWG